MRPFRAGSARSAVRAHARMPRRLERWLERHPQSPRESERAEQKAPSKHCRFDLVWQASDVIDRIFSSAHTIAVVGLSSDPRRPSHGVARYLQRAGYRIIPVNPNVDRVLGEVAYPSLLEVPESIDVVDVFRRSEFVGPVVDDAIAVKARALWLQDGVVDEAAARRARTAGLDVVMDDCMMRRHAT